MDNATTRKTQFKDESNLSHESNEAKEICKLNELLLHSGDET